MKAKLLLIVMLALVFGEIGAQTRTSRFSKEDVINRKWAYIQEKAVLSPADAAKVEPIFRETEHELWDLLVKNREAFRSVRRNGSESDANYEVVNEAIVNFEVANAQIQRKYYQKIKKVVSAKTVNQLLNADRDYKRELMQKMPGQQRGRNPQE